MNERYAILNCLRVTRHSTPFPYAPDYGHWVWDDTSISNYHSASKGGEGSWGNAKTAVEAIYAINALANSSGYPFMYTYGTRDAINFTAQIQNRYARYLTVRTVKTYPSRTHFYVKAQAIYSGAFIVNSIFDANGISYVNNSSYKYFSTTNILAGADGYSEIYGDQTLGLPVWCNEPDPPYLGFPDNEYRGWETPTEYTIYYQYWLFNYATNSL
jgi:hypothetical protein